MGLTSEETGKSREFNQMLSIETYKFSPSVIARRASLMAALACATALSAHAQNVTTQGTGTAESPLLAAVSTRPMDLASLAGVNYSSSTDSVSDAAVTADSGTLNLSDIGNGALQPPPRRRYGRPRYNDNSHNADGSNKYTFVGAVGFELPLANTYHYYNTSYAFQVGGGRQFSKHFAILAQFDYDKFGVNGQTLENQQNIYNFGCTTALQASGGCSLISGLDANSHIWSFTLNPVYTFHQGDRTGAYIAGGVGFYHKVTNFTVPAVGTYCDYYGFCYEYSANEIIDHYTSNAPGFNAGLGLTYKFSRFADEKFFIEARYVFIDNSQRTGITPANYTTAENTYTGTNYFPANSNHTTYVPIKVGIRF